MNPHHRHPANITRRDRASRSQRAADAVAAAMGSWRFIIAQSAVITGWITLNSVALVHHWDPAPYILLNLLFSTQAAYAAPILQLSSNSAAEHDRQRAEEDFATNQATLAELRELRAEMRELRGQAGG